MMNQQMIEKNLAHLHGMLDYYSNKNANGRYDMEIFGLTAEVGALKTVLEIK